MLGGRSSQRDRVTSIVDLPVIEQDAAGQRILAQCRCQPEGTTAAQMLVARHGPVVSAQDVIESDAGTDVPAIDRPPFQRDEDRDGSCQMGAKPIQEQGALAQRLANQLEATLLQVPQTTVQELARPAGCP